MHIGERIRQKRKELGLTQADLARLFGISTVSVSEWERGLGKPDQDKLPTLARKLKTTVNYLLTGRNDAAQYEAHTRSSLIHSPIGLPCIEWGEIAKWRDLMPDEKSNYAGERIPCPFPHSEDAFITRVPGESNFDPQSLKSFRDGDFIAVDPQREPKHLSMVLVAHAGVVELRQLLIEPDGSRLLKALAQGWPDRIRPLKEADRILGTVIGKWVPEE